jgi:hypothetical protein
MAIYVDGHWALAMLARKVYLLDALAARAGLRAEQLVDAARKINALPGRPRARLAIRSWFGAGSRRDLEALRPGHCPCALNLAKLI